MNYVIAFIGGAIAAAGAIGAWYFQRFSRLDADRKALSHLAARVDGERFRLTQQEHELEQQRQAVAQAVAAHDARKVQYGDLAHENIQLKQDLFNFSVTIRKMDRDHAAITDRQDTIEQKSVALAGRYLNEHVDWITERLTPNNFAGSKKRLMGAIQDCRTIGFEITEEREQALVQELKDRYEEAVRKEFAREEQARIKAQIREEERLAREIERQIQDAQREQAAIQAALDRALKESMNQHSAEVELLRQKLREAEERSERAKSQAQLTRAGYVYVISNLGTLGDGVFKIGMTRRLEPMERVRELGDASVPFPFDVHMMISCEDAPSLENALHRKLYKQRLNKVNIRKEFFRVDFQAIREVIEAHHGAVDYVAEPAALEYRESERMSSEDSEFVEKVLRSVIEKGTTSLAVED